MWLMTRVQTASTTTSVTLNAAATGRRSHNPKTSAPSTSSVDARRPTRVDNEAKACLDDVALNLQRTTDAKVALVGNAAGSEKMGSKKAAERAVNGKDYLVKEKGIDASRVSVYTGSQDGKNGGPSP